jgi:cytochrome P450
MAKSTARRDSDSRTDPSTSVGDRGEPDERERPPGPDGYPVVGNLPSFVQSPIGFLNDVSEYGDVATYQLLGEEVYGLFHPDHVERVLVTENDRFCKGELETNLVEQIAETSVVATEGEHWQRQRTAMQPAFTVDRIRTYAETMADYAAQAADEWADEGRVAVDAAATDLALRILAKSVFDLDVREGHEVVTGAAEGLNGRMDPTGLSSWLPAWVPTPANVRYDRRMAAFDELVEDLIERREDDPAEYDDLLAMLLEARGDGGLTHDEVTDQVKTFLFAGHETTATAITFGLFLLGNNPDPRRKLQAEADRVLEDDRPTVADVFELEYTDRVVTEVLRRYPPASGVFREPLEPVAFGGYDVPEGQTLLLPIYQIHNDERFYDDPGQFRPERWTDEFEASLPDYAYFPFGGGPRHCIGMRFARMELKIVFATLARRTEFEAITEDVEPTLEVTLTPDRPIEVAFERR